MENVVLSIHLILALLLIGVVLLQRSEGGGLGMGSSNSSGGGVGGLMTGRQAANALTRVTWVLAAGFFATSVTLTVLAAQKAGTGSVVDTAAPQQSAPADTAPANDTTGSTPSLDVVMPPPASGSDASTGGNAGETTTDTQSGPVTPPAAN
ncbi:preprotein translocase subunit SecG [Thioclava sp. JM3]|uniref:Protein-export membrane protein SecG n=1 Tax=Thioclava nitratireducens TaxID=1915078 RepID=A0ABM6IFQ3_9RHOB|nr:MULTISPECIES: preprotein translocase subunit SecG [Thioclava]AQS47608.1 preprotein translocase subunit SecG [Thioclava nitratireducens]OWY18042.1 preprotein translocase subunit SecG [Thioclava sp. JM3]PWE51249.1 preprotein translocase subunit SecG [Thioclava sp. NG1]